MCLTVPARVLERRGARSLVTSRGWTREVDTSQVSAKPGDYVLVQGGVAMITLGAREAEEIEQAWAEVEAAGTILHGARLRIKTVPANAACGACGRVVEVRPPSGRTHFMTPLTCDACGSGVTIEDGRGFVIRSAVMRLE